MARLDQTLKSDQTVTTDNDAYTAGDVVGGLITVPVSCPGGGGQIKSIRIYDSIAGDKALSVYLFDEAPTSIADDAAFATGLAVADIQNILKKISVVAGDYESLNSHGWAVIDGTDAECDFTAPDGNLYIYLVDPSGANWGAAATLMVRVVYWPNS